MCSLGPLNHRQSRHAGIVVLKDGMQQYSTARGGWVTLSLAYLFPIKEGKPIVLQRDGVIQIPSLDDDWGHANIPTAPADYHNDIIGVRWSF